jgi:protein-L-isoaspartate(D-aspartate) O-methyltransferase
VQGGDGVAIEPGRRNAIFIDAGVTHPHPKWLDSLIEGGRLVLPLTLVGGMSPNLGSGMMARFMRVGSDFSAQIVNSRCYLLVHRNHSLDICLSSVEVGAAA